MVPNVSKDHARTHEENRKIICLLCFGKSKNMRNLTKLLQNKVANVFEYYDESNDCLPTVICSSCKSNLYRENITKDSVRQIDFSKYRLPKHLRNNKSEKCECYFCDLARLNGSRVPYSHNVFNTKRIEKKSKQK